MKNKICPMCSGINDTTGKYCQACYNYLRKHPEGVYSLPSKGEVRYAPNGDPICHICGMAYAKLGNHIFNKHKLSQNEYREQFHLYRNTKLTNNDYRKKMSDYNKKYSELVVKENLLEKGKKTRVAPKQVLPASRKFGKPIREVFVSAYNS